MERLRQIREQAGYSQQELADMSGVGQHTISEIELGRRKPQGRTLRRLANVLGVEVADFYPKSPAYISASTGGGGGAAVDVTIPVNPTALLDALRRVERQEQPADAAYRELIAV